MNQNQTGIFLLDYKIEDLYSHCFKLTHIYFLSFPNNVDALTSVVNYLIISFAANGWLLYLGGVIAILDSTSTTMYRSMISKNVRSDEVGKVFSIVGTFQALLPFISGPTFNFLYKSTVEHFPQAWVFLVLAIRVFNFFVLLIVNIGMKKQQKRKEKHDSINHGKETKLNTENVS